MFITRTISLLACVMLAIAGCSGADVLNAVTGSSHYEVTSDVRYGDGDRHLLDVYLPKDRGARVPLVIFFYGAGWKGGSKESFEFVAASLTANGFAVIIPDYRVFPQVRFPAFVEDGAAAVAYAREHADELGVDASQFFLMGHSAGAHIASLIALDPHYLGGDSSLAGVVGLSGPYDFLPIESGYLLDVFPESSREQSQPINFVTADAPPMLLIHGGDDNVVKPGNSERLAERLREENVPVTLKIYNGQGHARLAAGLAPPLKFIGSTLDDSLAFLRSYSGDP